MKMAAAKNALTETLTLVVGKRRYSVASIEDASRMFCAARDKSGFGASKTATPLIYRADGGLIGYISYNGRVWSGHPRDWKPGTKPLHEAA
jgi:hypothetical protein